MKTMPFNQNFAQDDEESLIASIRKSRGCFNVKCRDSSATKRCTRCNIAVYCSKECQAADWNEESVPHKKVCKVYRDNVAPDTRPEGNGQRGAVAIGLLSVELIDEVQCRNAMRDRGEAFVKEAKRCTDIYLQNDKYGFRKATIGLAAAVVYNMGKPRLQCAVTVHDEESEIGFRHGMVPVNHIVFEAVGEGGEEVRKRLHPDRGSGNISEECRGRVVEILTTFVAKASNRFGLSIQSINYGRGLQWLSEEEYRHEKKELEKANGGNLIIWMPDQCYAMDDAGEDSKRAMGGLWGVE